MEEPEAAKTPEPDTWTDSFLLEDYKLKVGYLTGQFGRMWSRFQYFIVLEGGLSTVFFGFIKGDATDSDAFYVALTGAAVAACWYVFGAQDKYLVEAYRGQIRYVLHELFSRHKSTPLSLVKDTKGHRYPYTGSTDRPKKVKTNLLCWRSDRFSITHLAATFPLLVFAFWIVWVIKLRPWP